MWVGGGVLFEGKGEKITQLSSGSILATVPSVSVHGSINIMFYGV